VCRICKQQYEIKVVDVNKECIATVIKKARLCNNCCRDIL